MNKLISLLAIVVLSGSFVYGQTPVGAPINAAYITKTPTSQLTAEQALSALATGLVKNTTGTGTLSIATAGTDYVIPSGVITALDYPVVRIEPDGDQTGYGQNSASAVAVGDAMEDARDAASSGDVIFVRASSQVNESLAKNGVNWEFASGVQIYTEESDAVPFFSDGGSAMTFSVRGGKFVANHPDDEAGGLVALSAASTVFLDVESFSGNALSGVSLFHAGAYVNFRGQEVQITAGGNAFENNAGHLITSVNRVESQSGSCFNLSGGTSEVTVLGEAVSNSGEVVSHQGGTAYVLGNKLIGSGTVEIVNYRAGDLTIVTGQMAATNSSTGTIRIASSGDGTLRVVGAHISNTHATIGAVHVQGTPTGTKTIILQNCSVSSTSTNVLTADSAYAIQVNGTLATTQSIDSDITLTYVSRLPGANVTFDDTDNLWTATNIQAALEELNDSINSGTPNGTGAKVHWSQLLGMPAGFSDGTDDGAGGGSGTLTTIQEEDVSVDTDITTLDFLGADFDITESPENEANVVIATALTRDAEWDTWSEIGTAVSGTLAESEIDSAITRDAEAAAAYQPLDSDLTSWAGVTRGSGFDAFAASASSANLATLVPDETGTGGSLVFNSSPILTTPQISGAITFPDGVLQTFNPNGTNAGLNVGAHTADPSVLVNGDVWYQSTGHYYGIRINGSTERVATLDDITSSIESFSADPTNVASYDSAVWAASLEAELSAFFQGADAGLLQIANLADPNADRILFWDDSGTTYAYLAVSADLDITTTTLGIAAGITRDTEWDTWGEIGTAVSGTLAETEIDSAIARDSEVAAAYQPLDADLTDLADGSLTGTLVGFADTDGLWTATNVQAALEELNDSINAGAPNGTGAKTHWSQLLGVPAGFADGTDDGAGGGSGTVTTIEEEDVSVDTDIAVVDFLGADFDITESPENEANIVIAGAITRDAEWDTWSELATAASGTLSEAELDSAVTRDTEWDTWTEIGTAASGTVPTADLPAATDTAQGAAELATAAETTTGTDATRVVTPDGLAGSDFGLRTSSMVCFDWTTDIATGDGKFYMPIRTSLNGYNIVAVHAMVITAGTTGTSDIQIARIRSGSPVDVLSTKITIDSTETGSDTAATAAVINTSNDDMATNDILRVDVDAASTTKPKGLIVSVEFQKP